MSALLSPIVLVRADGLLSARMRCQRCGGMLDGARMVGGLAWMTTTDPAEIGALAEPVLLCEPCLAAEPVKAGPWPDACAAVEELVSRWGGARR